MKRHALFVGVNTYEDEQIRDLDFSLSDAHALKTLFELFGFESDILENPSKSDVFHAVRQMTAGLGAGDLFFFYFAGHGWTTTSGKHLLFCSDDLYEDLRDDDAGISFDKLKRKTTGDYNRAFVLDACRSDFITGTRGGDTTTRDLRPIGELVKDAPVKSSLAVLRSCSQYEHALEIRSRKHGLFTLAMMEVLRTSKDCGRELLFGEALCDAVTDKMLYIAKAEGITAEQTPEFAKTGSAQVLIEESRAAIPSMAMPTVGAQNFVVCPICGKHNDVTDTFKCPVCGKDHLCLSHQSKDYYCCPSCVGKKMAEEIEFRLKEADRLYDDDRFQQARVLYDKCAKEGNAHAQYMLGVMHDRGNGVAQNYVEAAKWYRKAAEQGDAYAQFNLGVLYDKGRGVAQEYAEAVKWYRLAAEQGDAYAQYNIGVLYERGRGVVLDYAEAAKWYSLAAAQNYVNAQYNLGLLYEQGRGVAQDYTEAVKWYRKAAERSDVDAQLRLAVMNEIGRGVVLDYVEAVKWYRKAAEQGNEIAQFNLGLCYANGKGVAVDKDEAAKWYRKSADQGKASAQYNLGYCYYVGEGVAKDLSEAEKWFRLAAEQGDVDAPFILGTMYYNGRGVSKSYEEAVKWFSSAAIQGHGTAQYNLGCMFECGLGVVRSYEQAAKWYVKAVDNGLDDARAALNRVQEIISAEKKTLPPPSSLEERSQPIEIYVGNTCIDVTEEDLSRLFGAFGKVLSARLIKNRCNGKSKGFGFVSMANPHDAEMAINALNGKEVQGRKLKCVKASNII